MKLTRTGWLLIVADAVIFCAFALRLFYRDRLHLDKYTLAADISTPVIMFVALTLLTFRFHRWPRKTSF